MEKEVARKKRYRKLISNGICTFCQKQEACIGFTLCADCQERKAEYYQQRKDEIRRKTNERRARYKALGLCVRCGKERGNNGTLQCDKCRVMSNFSTRKWKAKYK